MFSIGSEVIWTYNGKTGKVVNIEQGTIWNRPMGILMRNDWVIFETENGEKVRAPAEFVKMINS